MSTSASASLTSAGTTDCWDAAYRALELREPKLVQVYRRILSNNPSTTTTLATRPSHTQDQISLENSLHAHIEDAKQTRLAVKFRGKEFGLRETVDKILKATIFGQSLISQAVSGEPHAALAWAGVSLLLTPLMNAFSQNADAITGLERICTIILRFRVVELRILRPSPGQNRQASANEALRKSCEEDVVDMFSLILEYQIRLMRQYGRNKVVQLLRDVITVDSWKSKLEDILALERSLDSQLLSLGAEDMRQGFLDQEKHFGSVISTLTIQDATLQHLAASVHDLLSHNKRQDDHRKHDALAACVRTFSSTVDYRLGKDRNPVRAEGTCQWCLDHPSFKKWMVSDSSSLLFVTAEPGTGKSVLARYLVDTHLASQNDSVVCYYFFKDESTLQRSFTEAFCALLHQLLSSQPDLAIAAAPVISSSGSNIREQLSALIDLLLTCTEQSKRPVTCVLDALDEANQLDCSYVMDRINYFYRNIGTRSHILKFLITARPYFNPTFKFAALVDKLPRDCHLAGEEEPIDQELDGFIQSRIKELPLSQDGRQYLSQRMRNVNYQSKTYLWARLVFQEIHHNQLLQQGDAKVLAKHLGNISSLHEVYEGILNKSTDLSRTRRVLSLVISATRPLSAAELQVCLALCEHGNGEIAGESDLVRQDDLVFKRSIRAICGSFITFVWSVDLGLDQVTLLHQTAQEYLLTSTTPAPGAPPVSGSWQHSFSLTLSNVVMAQACVRYLLMTDVQQVLHELGTRLLNTRSVYANGPNSTPLLEEGLRLMSCCVYLEYCSSQWFVHMRDSRLDLAETVLPKGSTQLNDLDNPISLAWLWLNFVQSVQKSTLFHDSNARACRLRTEMVDLLVSTGFQLNNVWPNSFDAAISDSFQAAISSIRSDFAWRYCQGGVNFRKYLSNHTLIQPGSLFYEPNDENFSIAFDIISSSLDPAQVPIVEAFHHVCQLMPPSCLHRKFYQAIIRQDLPSIEAMVDSTKPPQRGWMSFLSGLGDLKGQAKPLTFREAFTFYSSLGAVFPDFFSTLLWHAKHEDSSFDAGPAFLYKAIGSTFGKQKCSALLQAGTSVNFTSREEELAPPSPLMLAVELAQVSRPMDTSIFDMLLKADADPTWQAIDPESGSRYTALSIATNSRADAERNRDLAERLLQYQLHRWTSKTNARKREHTILFLIHIHGCVAYRANDKPLEEPQYLMNLHYDRIVCARYDCYTSAHRFAAELSDRYNLRCRSLAAEIIYFAGYCVANNLRSVRFRIMDRNRLTGNIVQYTKPLEAAHDDGELQRRFAALGALYETPSPDEELANDPEEPVGYYGDLERRLEILKAGMAATEKKT